MTESTTDREIRLIRTIRTTIDRMWDMWTDPAHIARWWGPKGFTSTILTMDIQVGGEWTLTMHGPDGTDYPNRSIYREIVPKKKIVLEHFNPHFITTVLFEPDGEGIRMDWSLLFDTPEMRETVANVHKAEEGQRQNIEKLEQYLSALLRGT
jgi:uncharacterized protein YndB with AHSA1/START domain